MRKNTSANTMKYQDVSSDQGGVTKVDNAGMVTPECAYTSRLEGAKKEITAIITMVEKETEMTGHQTHTSEWAQTITSPTTLMEIGKIRMFGLRQEIFIKNRIPQTHPILLF